MADLNRIGGQHYEILRRCYDENCKTYKSYGAKGIKVCEEWHDREVFKEWAYAHGYVKGKRVLRKDNNADYCPDNCYIGDSPTETEQTTGFFISLESDNKRDGREYKTDNKDFLPISAQRFLKKAKKERIKVDPKIIKDNVNNIQYIYKL